MILARKRKLQWIIIFMTILAVVTALVLYALRQNISLFYSPTQVVEGIAPMNHVIRVGGMVVKGSVLRGEKDLSVEFKLTDYKDTIVVHYRGVLPDLFREGQGIVALGQMKGKHVFHASTVLAKHDENYMPREVKAALTRL